MQKREEKEGASSSMLTEDLEAEGGGGQQGKEIAIATAKKDT